MSIISKKVGKLGTINILMVELSIKSNHSWAVSNPLKKTLYKLKICNNSSKTFRHNSSLLINGLTVHPSVKSEINPLAVPVGLLLLSKS